jgi:cupin fold WbuC family metalloprotein
MTQIIDRVCLDGITAEAEKSARLRKNFNIHVSTEAACNRLFNAIEPASYIRPHRHLDPSKDESIIIVRGALGILVFDETGGIVQKTLLVPDGEAVAVNISPGVFHTAISLEPGTIFFEAKAGPYKPLTDEEFAQWAPPEGSPEAAAYLDRVRKSW